MGLVPIVKPKILPDIATTAQVQERVLTTVYAKLQDNGVLLQGSLLKPSMPASSARKTRGLRCASAKQKAGRSAWWMAGADWAAGARAWWARGVTGHGGAHPFELRTAAVPAAASRLTKGGEMRGGLRRRT